MSNSMQVTSTRSRFISLGVILLGLFGLAGKAYSQCSSPANQIVAENCLKGNPDSEWDVKTGDAGDPTIQGFATDISVNQGGTISFKINTPASGYSINIYRMGYYAGLGARKVAQISPSVSLPQSQPACMTDTTTGLIDCGNWGISAQWQVPTTATSGIYFAHLVRNDTGGDSHIVFIVRNDSSHSAILYQTSDESWAAYNYYGAGSLYGPASPNFNLNSRSYKVSYNRPFTTRSFAQESDTWVFGPEYPMVQWLEANGYDVTYFTGLDAARSGTLIQNHKIYMDSGHDEYWSGPHRSNVKAARDAGVNLAFFSGNEVFWKTRWENSIDGTNTPNRTLVCYKETLAFQKIDPTATWTGTWRDPSFSPPSDGGLPENALTGTLFMVNGTGPDNSGNQQISVPAADGKMRFWRNTAAATLAANATYTLPVGTLGYEWDVDADNGSRPAGAFRLSTSTYPLTSDLLLDYGATYGAGTATHHLMLYRAPSGALVFGAGTVNWSWGLNSNHDNPFSFTAPSPDPNMQQATVNLFADMGVQPATLQSGVVPAVASSDTTPPSSTITSPTGGTALTTGTTITVTGTASDSGGVVGGVEVSGDNGKTWHPATGRASWSYSWTPTVVGSATLLSRAVDDSGNLETPSDAIVLNVSPQNCPCSIWNASRVPTSADSGDGNSVEVGVKFRADANGSVLGVRFYKAPTNTGTHIGHVWSSTGSLLGTATFTGESSSGWQQANFSTPIQVSANTTYVVSYFAPVGHYSSDSNAFVQAGVDNPPLHALANGVDGQNGVFLYTSSGGFPNASYLASNYWVDVVFTSSNTYNISGTLSGYGGAGATVTLGGTVTGSTTADSSGNYTFNGVVNGSYTVTPSNAGVSFSPASQTVNIQSGVASGVNFTAVVTQPLSISGTLTGGAGSLVTLGGGAAATTTADASGNYSFTGLLGGNYSITPSSNGLLFTPGSQNVTLSGSNATAVNFTGQVCNCISIWQPTVVPTLVDANDGTSVEVGVKFRTDSPGLVDGVRFYKATANVGTHVGHLWSSTGVLLGSATFSSESASGWQQVSFTNPIQVTPNTTYVVSYFAPFGHYSADTNFFATNGVDSPPLHALANGVDGTNGIYTYTSSGTFPNNSYASTNYWVDVLFTPSASYTVSGTITGGAGATVTLSGSGLAPVTADSSGNYVFPHAYAGSYSVVPSGTGQVFTPGNQNVTISSSSITGVNFSVPQICPCNTIWKPATLPTVIDSGDGLSYELGVKFRADTDGYILGVRFYKSAANTGIHIGNLWSTANVGSLLSTSTFANESATGWQQVFFNTPVPVSAQTTYIGSYFTPSGHYSVDTQFFSTAGVDNVPLHALAAGVDGANGVYTNASMSAYPSSSYQSGNYWVDVIYATTATHSLAGSVTGPGAAGVSMALSGPSSATTTTDAYGNFTFSGLVDGTYTVIPSKAGFVISPGSQTITISGAHNLEVNFTSVIPTYPISGTVTGAPGISLSLAGGTIAETTTADASGNYTFAPVPSGSYTITPSGAGFAVSPANRSVVVNGAAVSGVNFNATVIIFSISGTVTGGPGATVSLSGPANATTTADSSGNYSFGGLYAGTYSITPSFTGVVFNPGNLNVTLAATNASGVNFTVPANCPCDTIWTPSTTPSTIDAGDVHSVEVGVKFRADADAYITGLRFYKATTNTGTHQGNLWSSNGTLLGTATFVNESASGWQQVFFAKPIPVVANTTYIASYFAPSGHYSGDSQYFATTAVNSPPLHALANGTDGPNGVYLYGTASAFPTATASSANYWVDVIYTPSSTYSVAGQIAGAGGAAATVTLSGSASATTTADASGNFAFPGLANGSYVVTPSASGYAFTPATQNATINSAHALGLAFTSSVQSYSIGGTITGAGASGATVTLSGTSSATTTSNASGTYAFAGLVNGAYTVTATNAGYIFAPASQSVTVNGANGSANFTASSQTANITGTISGLGGASATVTLVGATTTTTTASSAGVYSFANQPGGAYTVTPSKAGYMFTPASQTVTLSGANASINFASAVQSYSLGGTVAGGGGATLTLTGTATATATASSTGVYSFAGLLPGTYTVVPSLVGAVFTPTSLTFTITNASMTTANFTVPANCPCDTIWQPSAKPGTLAQSDPRALELGVKFRVDADGYAVGVRFYKGTPNTGTHLGHIWSSTGTLLGTASFVNESASGWQQVLFSNPIAVVANTTYIASYFAPVGEYSFDQNYFASSAVNSPPVHALANGTDGPNAVFAITSTGAFPNQNYNSSNYWVDVVYTPTTTYNVSGNISGTGGAATTVTLSGASSATTTTDASGNFTFAGVANGTYTVTPTKAGYSFGPASSTIIVKSAHVLGLVFTSTQVYSLGGTVSGAGGPGATVKLTGPSTQTVTANAAGVYSFAGLANGTYTVSATSAGYAVTPATQSVTVNGANATANFATAIAKYNVGGTLSGPGASGATVTLAGTASQTTTASSAGVYSFIGLGNGSYTVTPVKAGYAFTPVSQSITVNGANVTSNFSSVQTYTLTGSLGGAALSGTTMTLTGAMSVTTTANASGNYTFSGLIAGSYTLTPTKPGYTFNPTSQSGTINANATANFTATVKTYTISGTISGSGGFFGTVKLIGPVTQSVSMGFGSYSFTGLPPGTYTVTPANGSHTFSPANQVVTITGANGIANFSTLR